MIAVLTAGGTVDAAFARELGTNVKALAPWRGMKLIDPAIQAARACGASRIIVIGNHDVKAYCAGRIDEWIPAKASGHENLQSALECAGAAESLVLLTTDMPFISPDALNEFLVRGGEAEVAMPVATGDAYGLHYPNASNHVTNLGGERIANGNVFYFSSGTVAKRAIVISQRLFGARKSLIRMAALLDLSLMAKFVTKRLEVQHLEAYAQKRFALDARAIRNMAPSLCYDVDSLADYRYALAYHAE